MCETTNKKKKTVKSYNRKSGISTPSKQKNNIKATSFITEALKGGKRHFNNNNNDNFLHTRSYL